VTRLIVALAVALSACASPDDDDASGPPPDDDDAAAAGAFTYDDEVVCADPTDGFDRFVDDAAERGVAHDDEVGDGLVGCPWLPGVAAVDLDSDGDVDLLFTRERDFPHVYLNDGGGHFDLAPAGPSLGDRVVNAAAALDVDGDGIPDVVLTGQGFALLARGLGDGAFADPEIVWQTEGWPRACLYNFTLGDLDADGDLDLVLGGLDDLADETTYLGPLGETPPARDWLLLADAPGSWGPATELVRASGSVGRTMMTTFTDRDGDGDADLIVGTDRSIFPGSEPMAWFRNDGDGVLVDDAADVGGDQFIDAMGMGSADFNEDGVLDYCFSAVGAYLPCLFSLGPDDWFEGGLAAGLEADLDGFEPGGGPVVGWFSWGVGLADYDLDGVLDVAVAAGRPPDSGNLALSPNASEQPDAIWQGVAPGQFIDRTTDLAFGDPTASYGLVAADLAGDGTPDIVVARWNAPPTIWSNPCAAGAWATFEVGEVGARVEVVAGGRTRIRETYAALGVSQGPTEVHFGLGDADLIDEVRVRWSDGAEAVATNLPVRRRIRVTR